MGLIRTNTALITDSKGNYKLIETPGYWDLLLLAGVVCLLVIALCAVIFCMRDEGKITGSDARASFANLGEQIKSGIKEGFRSIQQATPKEIGLDKKPDRPQTQPAPPAVLDSKTAAAAPAVQEDQTAAKALEKSLAGIDAATDEFKKAADDAVSSIKKTASEAANGINRMREDIRNQSEQSQRDLAAAKNQSLEELAAANTESAKKIAEAGKAGAEMIDKRVEQGIARVSTAIDQKIETAVRTIESATVATTRPAPAAVPPPVQPAPPAATGTSPGKGIDDWQVYPHVPGRSGQRYVYRWYSDGSLYFWPADEIWSQASVKPQSKSAVRYMFRNSRTGKLEICDGDCEVSYDPPEVYLPQHGKNFSPAEPERPIERFKEPYDCDPRLKLPNIKR